MANFKLVIILLIIFTISSIAFYFNEELKIFLSERSFYLKSDSSIPKKATKNQYVLLSTNLDDKHKKFYFFYLPMLVEAWRRVGYKSIIFLVSSTDSNLENFQSNIPAAMKTVEYLKKLDVKLILIKSDPHYGVMTSMISRLFVGAIDFLDDEDYVLTSDSDLIPISMTYYKVQDYDAIGAWNGFCCGSFNLKNKTYEMYAMGHIGMKTKHWKGVMGLDEKVAINTKLIADLVKETFDEKVVKEDEKIGRGDQTWYADQVTLSSKIQIYSAKTNTTIRKRPYEGIRLDRIHNPVFLNNLVNTSLHKLTDFHAFHEQYVDHYKITEFLLKKLLDEKTFLIMMNYADEFHNIK